MVPSRAAPEPPGLLDLVRERGQGTLDPIVQIDGREPFGGSLQRGRQICASRDREVDRRRRRIIDRQHDLEGWGGLGGGRVRRLGGPELGRC